MVKVATPTDETMNFSLYGHSVPTSDPEDKTIMSGFDYPKVEEVHERYFSFTRTTPFPAGITNILNVTLTDKQYKRCHVAWMETTPILPARGENAYSMLPIYGYGWIIKSWSSNTRFKIDVVNDTGADLDFGTVTFKVKYQIWVNDSLGG